jgi:hypothetical protein
MYKFQEDRYRRARGGSSRVVDVTCDVCKAHVAYYQKDGPGILKRLYWDRFIDGMPDTDQLICRSCNGVLGIKYVYQKEHREAYRLFAGAVNKKVISRDKL